MKKRLISTFALVLALLFVCAGAGCAAPAAGTTTPASTAATEATTVAPEATTVATTTASTSQTVSEPPALEPVKLVWYTIFNPQTDQDLVFAEFSKYCQGKINAEVEVRPLDWGSYDQKLQTAAAAGEEFDLMWISDWMGVKYADFAANKNAIIPLDALIDQYAPKTKAFVNEKFWDNMKVNGSIYGVPCYQVFYRQKGMWINKALADKYQFDPKAFKTYKDLEPLYDAILANEKDIIPLLENSGYMHWFDNGSGPVPDRGQVSQLAGSINGLNVYASDPTKIVDAYTDPTLKEDGRLNIEAARDWYNKKYVRQDLLSIQDKNAEIRTMKYASGFSMIKPGIEVEFFDTNKFEVYFIPLSKPILNAVTATEFAISTTSKNPERTMMLIELLMNDKDAYNLICNGIEGKHYIKTAENRISRVESNGYQPNLNWALGNTFLAYLVPGQPDDLADQVKAGNDAAETSFMPDWTFNNEKVKNEVAATKPLEDEFLEPMWAGVLEYSDKYQEFQDKIMAAGHDAIAAEVQAQFDAYLASH